MWLVQKEEQEALTTINNKEEVALIGGVGRAPRVSYCVINASPLVDALW